MKPRLADAPNGIVGTGASNKRGDLLSQSSSRASHHIGASLPVDLLASSGSNNDMTTLLSTSSPRKELNTPATVALRPTPARAPVTDVAAGAALPSSSASSAGKGHRRTLSDSNHSNQPFPGVRDASSPRRGSHRMTRIIENTGPLQQDTRQQELVEKSIGGQKVTGLFTLRGRTPRNTRKAEETFDGGDSSSSLSLTSEHSLDLKRSSSKRGTAMFGRSSGSVMQMPGSPRGGNSTDGSLKPSPDAAPPLVSINAGPNASSSSSFNANAMSAHPEKRGFFAKLKGLIANKKEVAKAPKPLFSAAELDAREQQLALAGFSQLPGTLLSRAKGEEVDAKFLFKWNQFDLQREIGEGAYAVVYLANARLLDGSKKEVALKELKLQGNDGNEDIHLEAAAVADAIADCGFQSVAEALRLGSSLIRDPQTYREARTLLETSLRDFRSASDPDDDACGIIISIMEALIALGPPQPQTSIPAGKGAPQRLMEDVLREVEVLSKLWHKNIVEFVGCCVDLPHLAIAMQYAHKGPLSEILINDDVVLGWDLRVKWARETAEAVHYLHNLNPRIIHRDLKADNILIDRNNTALVTDFGLSKAKVLNMMNPAGAPSAIRRREVGAHAKYKSFVEFSEVAGTPSYLAPELWRNESYTESVDVYSYGVVLWEILARDAPFRELDNEELMLALRDQNLRPTIPKWTPEAYKLLTERCWSGSPNARPSFDQILKLLKILEDKHMYSWPPPENMSLDEDTQREIVIAWGKEKEEKEQAIKAAERKLLAAQMQLKTAKSSGNSSMSQDGPLLSPTPIHHGDQQQQPLKRKKSPVQEVFLK